MMNIISFKLRDVRSHITDQLLVYYLLKYLFKVIYTYIDLYTKPIYSIGI